MRNPIVGRRFFTEHLEIVQVTETLLSCVDPWFSFRVFSWCVSPGAFRLKSDRQVGQAKVCVDCWCAHTHTKTALGVQTALNIEVCYGVTLFP